MSVFLSRSWSLSHSHSLSLSSLSLYLSLSPCCFSPSNPSFIPLSLSLSLSWRCVFHIWRSEQGLRLRGSHLSPPPSLSPSRIHFSTRSSAVCSVCLSRLCRSSVRRGKGRCGQLTTEPQHTESRRGGITPASFRRGTMAGAFSHLLALSQIQFLHFPTVVICSLSFRSSEASAGLE